MPLWWFPLQPAGWKLKKEWLPDGWLCLVYFLWNYVFSSLFFLSLLIMSGQHLWPNSIFIKVCGASETQELPPNFIKLAKDAYTPDLMAASDCMLGKYSAILSVLGLFTALFLFWTCNNSVGCCIGKIGYGTVSEALAYKLPFVFVRRDYFNEEPFLRNMLEVETSRSIVSF